MQRQTKGDGQRRLQRNKGALNMQAGCAAGKGLEGGLDHAGKIGAGPIPMHQQIMGARQGEQS